MNKVLNIDKKTIESFLKYSDKFIRDSTIERYPDKEKEEGFSEKLLNIIDFNCN